MRLFDDRYKRTSGRTAPACGARRSGSLPDIDDENIVSMDEGGTNLFWAERYGKSSASRTCGSSSAATSHTGSFKDLGMTVLVSVGQADDRRRQADPRGRLRLDRRHLGRAGRLLRRGGHPRGRAPAARQGLDRAARPAARQRRAGARRSTPTSTAAWRSCRSLAEEEGDLPRQLDELAAPRGAEDGRASRSCSSSTGRCPTGVIIPGGNLGNVSALGAGFLMMQELGLIQQAAAHRVAQAEARQPALPGVPRTASTSSSRSPPKPTLAQRDPDRQPGERRKGDPHAAALRRRRRAGDRAGARRRGRARRPHRACSTARTPAWRSAALRSSLAKRARSIPTSAWS